MNQTFARFSMLIGEDNIEKLKNSSVIIFGIGGVGSYTAEALARSGIGAITLVDFDEISESNINRQVHALRNTIGKVKIEVMKERILNINPFCDVTLKKEFIYENIEKIFKEENKKYDFVVDSIDMIKSKIEIIEYCFKNNINIISSMGFGNKMYPEKIEIDFIEKTSVCPIARTIRRVLKEKNIKRIPAAYSKEEPLKPDKSALYMLEEATGFRKSNTLPKKIVPGSNAFVPPAAGLIIAGYVVRNLIGIK